MTAAHEQQKEYTPLLPVYMEYLIDMGKSESVKTQERPVRMESTVWKTYMIVIIIRFVYEISKLLHHLTFED